MSCAAPLHHTYLPSFACAWNQPRRARAADRSAKVSEALHEKDQALLHSWGALVATAAVLSWTAIHSIVFSIAFPTFLDARAISCHRRSSEPQPIIRPTLQSPCLCSSRALASSRMGVSA